MGIFIRLGVFPYSIYLTLSGFSFRAYWHVHADLAPKFWFRGFRVEERRPGIGVSDTRLTFFCNVMSFEFATLAASLGRLGDSVARFRIECPQV